MNKIKPQSNTPLHLVRCSVRIRRPTAEIGLLELIQRDQDEKILGLVMKPLTYRPFCLLDIAGKLFEWVISARFEIVIDGTGELADN